MAAQRSHTAGSQVKVRGPLDGLWRIGLYYVVLFGISWVLARSPWGGNVFEKVVFEGFRRMSQHEVVGQSFEVTQTAAGQVGLTTPMEFGIATVIPSFWAPSPS